MLLPQIIHEINELKAQATHRSCLAIFNLLENNRALFLQKMEAGNFNHVYSSFERLGEANASEYNSPAYKEEYAKAHGLLMFYLDRIV